MSKVPLKTNRVLLHLRHNFIRNYLGAEQLPDKVTDEVTGYRSWSAMLEEDTDPLRVRPRPPSVVDTTTSLD